MIHVIASICVAEGKIDDVLKIYDAFVPQVKAEEGCLMYLPTVDFETDIATQQKDSHAITVIEKWETIDNFHAHLNAPHVIEFREKIKGLVIKVSIKVLQEAL